MTKRMPHQSRIDMPNKLERGQNRGRTHSKQILPEDVKAIALVIQRPARPAPSVSVAIENKLDTRTATAPKESKFSKSHRLVIQKVYHICGQQ
jgi:hypothetical protein